VAVKSSAGRCIKPSTEISLLLEAGLDYWKGMRGGELEGGFYTEKEITLE
jgi:hypothetical protein